MTSALRTTRDTNELPLHTSIGGNESGNPSPTIRHTATRPSRNTSKCCARTCCFFALLLNGCGVGLIALLATTKPKTGQVFKAKYNDPNHNILVCAHNAGSASTESSTSVFASSQYLTFDELLTKTDIRCFEVDLHVHKDNIGKSRIYHAKERMLNPKPFTLEELSDILNAHFMRNPHEVIASDVKTNLIEVDANIKLCDEKKGETSTLDIDITPLALFKTNGTDDISEDGTLFLLGTQILINNIHDSEDLDKINEFINKLNSNYQKIIKNKCLEQKVVINKAHKMQIYLEIKEGKISDIKEYLQNTLSQEAYNSIDFVDDKNKKLFAFDHAISTYGTLNNWGANILRALPQPISKALNDRFDLGQHTPWLNNNNTDRSNAEIITMAAQGTSITEQASQDIDLDDLRSLYYQSTNLNNETLIDKKLVLYGNDFYGFEGHFYKIEDGMYLISREDMQWNRSRVVKLPAVVSLDQVDAVSPEILAEKPLN